MSSTWQRSLSFTRYIRLYLLIAFLALASFAVVNVTTLTLNGATRPPADPFALYADLLPGQSSTALSTYGFTCHPVSDRYAQTAYCSLTPTSGDFSLVEVFLDPESTVAEIDFTLRNNLFKVGDLMLLWGKPTVHPHADSINFIWQNGAGATTQYSRHISFSLTVQKVYFMALRPKIPVDQPAK